MLICKVPNEVLEIKANYSSHHARKIETKVNLAEILPKEDAWELNKENNSDAEGIIGEINGRERHHKESLKIWNEWLLFIWKAVSRSSIIK